jgi:hypothetical protein
MSQRNNKSLSSIATTINIGSKSVRVLALSDLTSLSCLIMQVKV